MLGRLLFGNPLVGVGAPTPCRGGAPGAEIFLSELASEDSLLFVTARRGGGSHPLPRGASGAEIFLPWTRLEELSSLRGLARSRSREQPVRRGCGGAYC